MTGGRHIDRALGEHIEIDSSNIPAGVVVAADVADATITNAKLVNSTIQAGKISFAKSSELTGTGAPQNYAHGLSRTPALVLVFVTEHTSTIPAIDISEGAHTSTNVVLTVTAGVKFKVVAL